MSLSPDGLEYLAVLETWGKPVPFRTFKDERGRLACGYGHVLAAGEYRQMPISRHTAMTLLEADCKLLWSWMSEKIDLDHPQHRLEAVLYWLHQSYQGRALAAGQMVEDALLWRYMQDRHYQLAAAELDKWVYLPKPEGLRFSRDLARRRAVEQQYFLTGVRPQLIAHTDKH